MLEIGNAGLSETECRAHMSLWFLLASPLLTGNDLRNMDPAILAILTNKEVIAVDQDTLGKQGTHVAKAGDLEIWSRLLADGAHAVILLNRGADAALVAAEWSDLGIQGAHRVRDLWAHQDLGKVKDRYIAQVSPHGVVMIKIAKQAD